MPTDTFKPKLVVYEFSPYLKETQPVSITRITWIMVFGEIPVYCENHTKLCGTKTFERETGHEIAHPQKNQNREKRI
jgi:hypothetical protein